MKKPRLIGAIDHDREADPVDPRLLMDQRADGLVDLVIGRLFLAAFLGAVVNLYVVEKARRLRSRPASQWRQQPVTRKKLNSERFQIALSVLTLLLLAAEWIIHPLVHRVP